MRDDLATIRLFLTFTQGREEFNLRTDVTQFYVRWQTVEQIHDHLFVAHVYNLPDSRRVASSAISELRPLHSP